MAIRRLCLLFSILYFSLTILSAQSDKISGNSDHTKQAVAEHYIDSLEQRFGEYDVFSMQIRSDDSKYQQSTLDLTLPSDIASAWELELYRDDLIPEDYINRFQTASRLISNKDIRPHVYMGNLNGNTEHKVGLTVYEDFLYGGIYTGEELYMVEPLRFLVKGAPRDLFVIYATSKILKTVEGRCGFEEYRDMLDKDFDVSGEHTDRSTAVACYELELAIASDFSMYSKYNDSEADVISHNVAVINNVQTNYTGEFDDDIEFEIVEQFVSTCSSCDPWTSSNDAGALLSDFRSWGNSGGFSTTFDLGELWTNRDFNGPTIGIAYLSSVCGFSKYHCLQDFTGNADLLRVLTAHEIGHNFSATHDPSGSNTIMAPSVNITNQWSSQSVNDISGYINSIENDPNCLEDCFTPPPPEAGFSGNPTTICTGSQVQYTDESTGTISSWSWTFDGGTPSSSTMQDPSVTYNTPGTYSVTLEVSNSGGSDTETKTNYITVADPPVADFDYTIFGNTVQFTNISQNGDMYTWDFGDGSTTNEENPDHFYEEPGTYTVTLTVENDCSTDVATEELEIIIAPEADFSADPQEGCAELVVDFFDESDNNPTQWTWTFEGGVPSSSTQQNPTVNYPDGGTYNVTLVVTNQEGSDQVVKTDFITVSGDPLAGFEYATDGATVDFTNTSQNGNTYTWDFGDGTMSSEENPTHTYSNDSTYEVQLTVSNDCGMDDTVQSIEITTVPLADFTADTTEGCPPSTINFEDLSSGNTTSWDWSFPGGIPSSSNQQNPAVTYASPGTYDVTLIASNDSGSDTITKEDYIDINQPSEASFNTDIDQYTVAFNNTSTDASSYQWHFGDGTTSMDENPVHTYSQDSVYDVMLIAFGSCDPDTVVQSIALLYPPQADFTANTTEGCEPLTVHYTSQASPNTDSWNWSFSGGTPSSSSEENPVVTYDEPGTYDVSLIVSNGQGSDQLLRQDYITVNPLPEADFTFVRDELLVDFTDQSNHANSWFWDFGDGSTSTARNPDHTYDSHGTYSVLLVAENDCGTDSFEMELEVNALPAANFTADTTEGCAPLTVNFSDQSSTNVTSWEWTFPGGQPGTSDQENPNVVYNEPGTYDVNLIVSNSEGSDTMLREDYVTVLTTPTAGFSYSKSEDTVSFENMSEHDDSWMWGFGDGFTSIAEHPAHIYQEDGTYTVQLISSNQCGSDTARQTLTVLTPPTAGFSASVTESCIPANIEFNNESTSNAAEYLWTFEGGNPEITTDSAPVVTYDEAGIYDVSLIVSNDAGSDTVIMEDYIDIGEPPVADFTYSVDDLTVQFQDSSSNADSLHWSFGDMTTANGTMPVHEYSEEGLYMVTLIAYNNCGTDTTTLEVGTSDYPQSSFSVSSRSGCVPFEVSFSGTMENNVTSWEWTFEGGTPSTSSAQNPIVTYEEAGQYDVTLTVSNAVGAHTLTKTAFITALDVPAADFTVMLDEGKAIFVNESDRADGYYWNFGDGLSDTIKNPVHEYSADGEYTVDLIAENACGEDTTSQEIEIQLSAVSDLNDPSVHWTIFPNPTDDRLFITCSDCNMRSARWTVLSQQGRSLESGTLSVLSTGSEKASIDLNGLTPGMYYLEINDGTSRRYFQFIVQ